MIRFTLLPTAFTRLALHLPLLGMNTLPKTVDIPVNHATARLDRIMAPYRPHPNLAVARLERIMASEQKLTRSR